MSAQRHEGEQQEPPFTADQVRAKIENEAAADFESGRREKYVRYP